VASDTSAATIGAYDAGSASHPGTASRISYVIDPQGKIVFVHEGSDPLQHVELTLQAVRQLHDAKP
jgi:peroxiredoxin